MAAISSSSATSSATPRSKRLACSISGTATSAAPRPALRDEEVSRKLVELGALVRPSTRAEFAGYMKDQEAGVSELVKSGLLKPE